MLRTCNENERIIQAVIFRQGGEKTCAIVRALVPKSFGEDWDTTTSDTNILMGAIQLAVTEWFHVTNRGKQVIEDENYFDFNVGDLAEKVGNDLNGDPNVRFDESDLCWFLQQQSILGLEVETYQSDDAKHCWDFDDKLFDESEVGD